MIYWRKFIYCQFQSCPWSSVDMAVTEADIEDTSASSCPWSSVDMAVTEADIHGVSGPVAAVESVQV